MRLEEMKIVKKYFPALAKSILAGILIGIAGTIYLTLVKENQKVLGSFMFGFGLLVIVANGLYLYTGKVGYLIDKDGFSIQTILLMVIGNLLGLSLIVAVLYMSNQTGIIETAKELTAHKMEHTAYEMLGLSILCGMMMYLGVEGYRRIKNDVARVVIVIMAVSIFILAGFEHSIADLFYFLTAWSLDWKAFGFILILLVGNGIGAIVLNLLEKAAKIKE